MMGQPPPPSSPRPRGGTSASAMILGSLMTAALLSPSCSTASAAAPPSSCFVASAAVQRPSASRGGGIISGSRGGGKNRWGPPRPGTPLAASSTTETTIHGQESASAEGGETEPSEPVQPAAAASSVTTRDVLSLPSIRSTLIRQEETIIFALIERSQFRGNDVVYRRGGFGDLGLPMGVPNLDERWCGEEHCEPMSLLEYMLAGTEALHCAVRRYTSPEEHAFFPDLMSSGPLSAMPDLDYPTDLLSADGGASAVNFNPILMRKYIDAIVPSMTEPGDDEQHGSTVVSDIAALQALSRRVHYGKFVAESKYRSDPEGYQRLVDAGDADGVMALLTNEAVERQVLRRARLKAATYGREPLLAGMPDASDFGAHVHGDGGVDPETEIVAAAAASAVVAAVEATKSRKEGGGQRGSKVDPTVIEDIYENIIIPLTKDIEVAYLFRRCGREPPAEFAPDRMSVDVVKEREAQEEEEGEAKAP